MNAPRVGLIGMGWVGSSTALSILHAGIASELWLNDAKPGLAEGEALDLQHGAAFYPTCSVRAAEVEAMRELDVVVIAAGKGGVPGQSRLDLLTDNIETVRGIASSLCDLQGTLVVVSNPVDILTKVATEASGLPPSRVLGTGTMLDTTRLRTMVGRELGLAPRSVHAYIVGEHGDSQVPLWSRARAGAIALRAWDGWDASVEQRLADEARTAAQAIIRRKGATNHAIGLVTTALLRVLLRDESRILTVSQVQNGPYGLRDVALSLPTVVGRSGAHTVLAPTLSPDEANALGRSAEVLRARANPAH